MRTVHTARPEPAPDFTASHSRRIGSGSSSSHAFRLFGESRSSAHSRSGPRNQSPTGLSFGTGVKLVSTEKLFVQGALKETQRPLDLAINSY